ncbi:MAG: hypothetical protein ABSF79_11750 [Smithellaceae bacterium]|jgi:tetratricopeptide (TPR) repeat protein
MKIGDQDFNLEFQRNYKLLLRYLFVVAALLVILLLSYSNSFNCSWHFDDHINIVKNVNIQIKQFTWENVKKIFYGIEGIENTGRIARPVSYLSFALNYYFGGLNIFGYHLINFLIHFFSSLFLFLFIINTLRLPLLKERYEKHAYSIALLATVFWAINPVHVTSITYIVQRMTSMAALFYIMSMYFYLKFRTSGEKYKSFLFILLCLLFSLLALGTKENTAMLPASIFLYDLFLIQGLTKGNIKKNLKIIIVPLIILITAGLLFYDFSSIFKDYELRPFTMKERLLTEPRVILFYISLLFYPLTSRLTLIHDIQISKGLFDPWTTFAAIIIILIIIILALVKARRWPLLSYCVLFFFLNHVIEGSFLPLELIYEHRNYLPSMLIFVPVVILLINSLKYFSQRKIMFYFLAAAVSLIIIIQGVAVYIQNDVMKDEISLWSDNVEKSPRVHHSRQCLAVALLVAGRLPEALKELEEAKKSYLSANIAKRSITYGALGEYYYITRNDKKAFEYFDKSIKLYPSHPQMPLSYDRMAILLMWKGQLDKAEEMARKAISLQPYVAEYYLTYSAILIKKRQPKAAIKNANKALMLDPDLTNAYNFIADAFKLEKNKKAELHFRKLGAAKSSKCP